WVLYIALEPYVRRTWPTTLISWSRVIDGRFRDRRVARDVLVGLAATGFLDGFEPLLALVTPVPPRGLIDGFWIAAGGVREAVGAAISEVTAMIALALVLTMLVCLVRMVVRRDWIVTVAFAAVVGVVIAISYAAAFNAPLSALFVIVYGAVYGAVWAGIAMRF